MKEKKFNLLLILKKLKKNKSRNGLNTLIEEREKLTNINKTLSDMMNSSCFPKNELMSSGLIQQISKYQGEIQQKIDTSKSRKEYLSAEISQNLKQLAELKKQTDTIEDKIDKIKKRKLEIKEIKSEINILNKPNF